MPCGAVFLRQVCRSCCTGVSRSVPISRLRGICAQGRSKAGRTEVAEEEAARKDTLTRTQSFVAVMRWARHSLSTQTDKNMVTCTRSGAAVKV